MPLPLGVRWTGSLCANLVIVMNLPSSATAAGIKKWRILGPFVIGKNELDGEPWRTANVSELVAGGEVTPRKFTADKDGVLAVEWPTVPWQALVNGVGGHELLEWQALAQGTFKVSSAGLYALYCAGVSAFSLGDDSVPFVGDQYNAGLPGMPVQLDAGVQRISVRLRAKIQATFRCTVEHVSPMPSPVLFGGSFAMVPDAVDGILASDLVALPAANSHPTEWLGQLQVTAVSGPELEPSSSQPVWSPLAPGQTARLPVRLSSDAFQSGRCPGEQIRLSLEGQMTTSQVVSSRPQSLPPIRCRRRDQSFVFTFLDSDGSVQHAAAVMPRVRSDCGPEGCPVVITLHGTSISASDSADSYKMKSAGDEDYRFGVAGAWLLAPTRHGAHNWEGPGRQTALAALTALSSVARTLGAPAPNSKQVVVAGHSMGGHGAWLLGLSLRDAALGLVSHASWLRKDQYHDSNKVLLHDVASPDVEPALSDLLRAAESEFDVEAHAATLSAGLRILIRVGSKDTTVHPWFSRRMFRTLLSNGGNATDITVTEVSGKEHWWWDTNKPNDGGAVNDEQIRAFFQDCLSRHAGVQSLPSSWRLVVFNPATASSKGGLRVAEQNIPFRRSEVSVVLAVEHAKIVVYLNTSNTLRLEWRTSDLLGMARAHAKEPHHSESAHVVMIDGHELQVPANPDPVDVVAWCQDASGTWAICDEESDSIRRTPATLGPMRQVFANQVCAVVSGAEAVSAVRYVANLLVMTGHGQLPIVSVEDVVDASGQLRPPAHCRNLLIAGTAETNAAIGSLLRTRTGPGSSFEAPVSFEDGAMTVAGCRWSGQKLAVLSLLPWWSQEGEQRLALLAAGPGFAEALASLATPTIPPMTRQPLTHLLPDYVVLDVEETRARGAGGFLAAGFWSSDWRPVPQASWERFCRRGSPAGSASQLARPPSSEL